MKKWNFSILFLLLVTTHVLGAEAEPENQASRSIASAKTEAAGDDNEFNFSWLDPDKKVYVLQNRKYRKSGHFALFVSGAFDISNPYRTSYLGIPRAAYWFSEQFGVEAFFAKATNSDNSTLRELKDASPTALPFVREHRSYYGALFTWTPWYAKINFFNKILYFDWFINLGLGQTNTAVDKNIRADRAPNYTLEDLFTVFYGTGQNFYVTRNFLVRWDLIGMTYNATGTSNQKGNSTNFNFGLGIGYLF